MNRFIQVSIGFSMVLVAGCAMRESVPPERISSSEAAVRAADEAGSGAPDNASAQLHLRLARDELALAHQLQKDDPRRSEMLFIRARVDAELAQTMASTSKAKQEANQARVDIEKLQASAAGTPAIPNQDQGSQDNQ